MYFKSTCDTIALMQKNEQRGISYASKGKGKAGPAVKGAAKTTQIIVNPKDKVFNIEDWLKKPENSKAKIHDSDIMDVSSSQGQNGILYENSMEFNNLDSKKKTGENLLNFRESVEEASTNEYIGSGIHKNKPPSVQIVEPGIFYDFSSYSL